MDTDYFELLNVPQNTSSRIIKSAYRKMVNSLHPDTPPGDPLTEVRMKKINAAYQVTQDVAPCAKMLRKALKICPDDQDVWFNMAYAQALNNLTDSTSKENIWN